MSQIEIHVQANLHELPHFLSPRLSVFPPHHRRPQAHQVLHPDTIPAHAQVQHLFTL